MSSYFDGLRADAKARPADEPPRVEAEAIAELRRKAEEARVLYQTARVDAYEKFCRTLAAALLEACTETGRPAGDEDTALREITRRFPFKEF